MKDTTYNPLDRNHQRKAAKDIPLTTLGFNVTRVVQLVPGDRLALSNKLHAVVIVMEPRPLGVDGRSSEARARKRQAALQTPKEADAPATEAAGSDGL